MRSNKAVLFFLIFFLSSLIYALPCEIPDNGTGTITLPPMGCDYLSPDNVWLILDGLPAGATIELDGPLTDYICGSSVCSGLLLPGECEGIGGALGGNFQCFEATLELQISGTGALTGFDRFISFPVSCEVHTGPRNPGYPVQTFPIRMYRMQGELLGDPDFDLLRITAGNDYGLPSPGETTLTQLPNGNFNVDSFFDITYQIEFIGSPGSVLDGLSGTSTGIITVHAGESIDLIDPGQDFWIVPESPVSSIHIGGSGGEIDLPPDYFGPGSDPFDGVVALQGESYSSAEFPNADAIIGRISPANLPEPYPAFDIISTEIIELNLVGTEPITVTYNGGQNPELWDVVMQAAPSPQNPGNISIIKNDANGGEFYYSPIDVYPRLIFTKVDLPNTTLIVDLNYLEYSNPTAYPWEHSPIGNDFNPSGTYPMELISAGGDCELYLMPYLLRQDDFWVEVGINGDLEGGGGSGYNNGEWYEYTNTGWWNIWFYDHPYATDRRKGIHVLFAIQGGGYATVVVNWSTPGWVEQGITDRPPLPGDEPETSYIIRSDEPLFDGPVSGITVVDQYFEIPEDYNPEWISIDISTDGYDFIISDGFIEHVCFAPNEEPEELDFGDAPDPMYPTLLASDGARHILDGLTYFGIQIDPEPDAWQDPNALGDDNNDLSDEDGITLSEIKIGSPAQVNITTNSIGYLQGWIDFNSDGDWTDPGEQIITDIFHYGGGICLNYFVPTNAILGSTFARFRLSTVSGLGIIGLAPDGEVEDYEVEIIENPDLKWSQQPCIYIPGLHSFDYVSPPYSQIVLADDWLCNGGLVTGINWWGNYEMNTGVELRGSGIDRFHLSIHLDDPLGTCLPLDPEMWGIDVPFSSLTEVNTGLFNSESCPIYLYEYILEESFPQIEGVQYWLDVTAICSDPTDPAYWRWQESSRNNNPIMCGAVGKTIPTPGTWNTIVWPSNPSRYSDMAFEITNCPPSTPVNFTITKVGTNMSLQWDPDPCLLYYYVYSSTDPYATFPGGWTLEPTGTQISTTTWNDPLPAGSKKFYRVTAEN